MFNNASASAAMQGSVGAGAVAMNYTCESAGSGPEQQQPADNNTDVSEQQTNILNAGFAQRQQKGPSLCSCGCGSYVNTGSARNCGNFRKKSVAERLKIVADKSLCKHCLFHFPAVRLKGHEEHCGFSKTNVCRAHGLHQDANHNWLLCKVRESQFQQNQQFQQSVNNTQVTSGVAVNNLDLEEPVVHDTGLVENDHAMMFTGWEDGMELMDPYECENVNAFHVSAVTDLKARNNNSLFSDKIGVRGEDYDQSKYNIQSALENLLEAARRARSNPVKDVKRYEESLVAAQTIIVDLENEFKTIRNLREEDCEKLVKMKKLLNDTIQALDYDDSVGVISLLTSKRRIIINRAHQNKDLFRNMLEMGVAMFKASGKAKKGTLGVCPVRLRLKDKKDLDMYGWVTSGNI